jgi:site-specific recombinase XerD
MPITMRTHSSLPGLLEAFFTEYLMHQRQASPNTSASYRDTFRLLLERAQRRLKKAPATLTLDNLDAPFLGEFLSYLEKDRGNSARTRNTRLAAIHSFFRYAALQEPGHSALIQRVLAMPSKRHNQAQIEFLTRSEVQALLAAPDQGTWAGRRDRTMLLVAVNRRASV